MHLNSSTAAICQLYTQLQLMRNLFPFEIYFLQIGVNLRHENRTEIAFDAASNRFKNTFCGLKLTLVCPFPFLLPPLPTTLCGSSQLFLDSFALNLRNFIDYRKSWSAVGSRFISRTTSKSAIRFGRCLSSCFSFISFHPPRALCFLFSFV